MRTSLDAETDHAPVAALRGHEWSAPRAVYVVIRDRALAWPRQERGQENLGLLVTVDALTSVEECAASGWAGWGRAHRTRPLTGVGPEGCPDRRVRWVGPAFDGRR